MDSLENRLRAAFPNLTDADFGYHESDLYVISYPGIREWLKANYEFYKNIESFVGQGDYWQGKMCLDIPFANAKFWEEKARHCTG